MTIHQLSIFLENKSGTLVPVLDMLKDAGVQLIAITIADTSEYGICRIICSEPLRAFDVLKGAGVAVSLSEVFAVELDDVPGRAADAISVFAREGLSIAYLYSFRIQGKGALVFRTDNAEKASDAILREGLRLFSEDDLSTLV